MHTLRNATQTASCNPLPSLLSVGVSGFQRFPELPRHHPRQPIDGPPFHPAQVSPVWIRKRQKGAGDNPPPVPPICYAPPLSSGVLLNFNISPTARAVAGFPLFALWKNNKHGAECVGIVDSVTIFDPVERATAPQQ